MKNLLFSEDYLNNLYKDKIVQIYHTGITGDEIIIEQYIILKVVVHHNRRPLLMLSKNNKHVMKLPFDMELLKTGKSQYNHVANFKIINSRNRLIFDSSLQDIKNDIFF